MSQDGIFGNREREAMARAAAEEVRLACYDPTLIIDVAALHRAVVNDCKRALPLAARAGVAAAIAACKQFKLDLADHVTPYERWRNGQPAIALPFAAAIGPP